MGEHPNLLKLRGHRSRSEDAHCDKADILILVSSDWPEWARGKPPFRDGPSHRTPIAGPHFNLWFELHCCGRCLFWTYSLWPPRWLGADLCSCRIRFSFFPHLLRLPAQSGHCCPCGLAGTYLLGVAVLIHPLFTTFTPFASRVLCASFISFGAQPSRWVASVQP